MEIEVNTDSVHHTDTVSEYLDDDTSTDNAPVVYTWSASVIGNGGVVTDCVVELSSVFPTIHIFIIWQLSLTVLHMHYITLISPTTDLCYFWYLLHFVVWHYIVHEISTV